MTSKTLAKLSHGGERFFWRLTLIADDFGRFEAEEMVLLARCYPMMLDRVKRRDVRSWLAEIVDAGLVVLYCLRDKSYGFFVTWGKHQRVRAKFSKYPAPSSADICRHLPAMAPEVTEEPVVPETPDLRSPSSGARPDVNQPAREILDFLNRKAGRNYQPTVVNLDFIRARLKEGATVDQCRAVIGRKTAAWKGDEKMDQFLRPATLFNRTKFAQYLGELPATAFQVDPDA